jgi:hypothetical protein
MSNNLLGMRGHNYGEGLYDLISYVNRFSNTKEMTMIEIGSYAGESTEIFSKFFKKVISIDPFIDNYDPNDAACHYMSLTKVYDVFMERISVIPNISHVRKTSDDAILDFQNEKVDLVYIDGMHTYEQVYKDIENYIKIVNKDGFISGHDYCPGWPGVIRAVNEQVGVPDEKFKDNSWIKRI